MRQVAPLNGTLAKMCGRLDQSHTAAEYLAAMHWPRTPLFESRAQASFNVAPGTYRPVIHAVDHGFTVDDLFWGYRAAWAIGKVPIAINARLEKITNGYWGALLLRGRAIVPANGWYEWSGEKGEKQAWHIHLKTREPMFMAALAAFGPFREHASESGFAIVTSDAQGGSVDVHARRPVVFSADDAARWLSPDLSADQAEQLVRTVAIGSDAFAWHRVSNEIGNVSNDGPHLTQALD